MPKRALRRSAFALLAALMVSVACPKDDPPVPVVTTITVTPGTRTFTALTQTQLFSASVMDQNGNAMTGQAVAWGTSSATVATVTPATPSNPGGLVTAQSVGTANITATIGSVVGTAMVTVTQVPATLSKPQGDAQSAPISTQLPLPLIARLVDAMGIPVPGLTVTFAVTTGGGSVSTPSSTTNASGQVTTTWTLGSAFGPQSVTASTPGVTSVVYNATGLAAPPDTVIKNSVDGQSVPAGTPITPAPSVLVRDQFGNPTANIAVTFAVTVGGGQVTGPSQFTNASGIATVGSWTAGAAGPQEMTATVTGSGIGGNPVTFVATATPAGAPNSITVSSGNGQTGLQGFPDNFPIAALVRDAASNPVQGVTVTFAVTGGGGSMTGASATTNLQGIARVGSWTINAGANAAEASVAGVATPAAFTATGVPSTFNIEIRYSLGSTPSPAMTAAFDSAKARWQRVIFGDEGNVNNVNITPNSCGNAGLPASTENIDDLLIFAILVPIDGQGGILGSAGPCAFRSSDSTSLFGLMRFDTADLAFMEQQGILEDVILHEMGHVLGLGTLWNLKGLLTGGGTIDSYFTGAFANLKFDDIGGDDFTGGGTVPVENCQQGVPPSCGPGTRDGHWREFVFTNELMTGYIDIPAPMSVVTIAQYGDIGYQVNLGEADTFGLPLRAAALRAAGKGVHLGDDFLRIPVELIDANGRVVRTIQPR